MVVFMPLKITKGDIDIFDMKYGKKINILDLIESWILVVNIAHLILLKVFKGMESI